MTDTLPPGMAAARRYLSRHLVGKGVELGPGHQPFPLPGPGVQVRYVDRWRPDENRKLFFELDDDAEFPEPDIVANFDVDRLHALDDDSQDFVICSHLLEHLAEPIGFVCEIHRVLRPGGVVLILLPDRRLTFDKDRGATSLGHLVAEYEAGVQEVDEAHLIDFNVKLGGTLPGDPAERAELFDLQRRRSVHVHCWTEDEFLPVLIYGIRELGQRWQLVEAIVAEDWPESNEFGFVLRRSTADVDGSELEARFVDGWDAWRNCRRRPG